MVWVVEGPLNRRALDYLVTQGRDSILDRPIHPDERTEAARVPRNGGKSDKPDTWDRSCANGTVFRSRALTW